MSYFDKIVVSLFIQETFIRGVAKSENLGRQVVKCFDHKNYGDWKLRGPCRENLHYLWKRAVRIAVKTFAVYNDTTYLLICFENLGSFENSNAFY
jgi:hypothetical protein